MCPYQATWQAWMECFTYRMKYISNKEPTDNAWKETGPFKIKKHYSNQANQIFFPTSLWHRSASCYCERWHFTSVPRGALQCAVQHPRCAHQCFQARNYTTKSWLKLLPLSPERMLIGPAISWLKHSSDWSFSRGISQNSGFQSQQTNNKAILGRRMAQAIAHRSHFWSVSS